MLFSIFQRSSSFVSRRISICLLYNFSEPYKRIILTVESMTGLMIVFLSFCLLRKGGLKTRRYCICNIIFPLLTQELISPEMIVEHKNISFSHNSKSSQAL